MCVLPLPVYRCQLLSRVGVPGLDDALEARAGHDVAGLVGDQALDVVAVAVDQDGHRLLNYLLRPKEFAM